LATKQDKKGPQSSQNSKSQNTKQKSEKKTAVQSIEKGGSRGHTLKKSGATLQ